MKSVEREKAEPSATSSQESKAQSSLGLAYHEPSAFADQTKHTAATGADPNALGRKTQAKFTRRSGTGSTREPDSERNDHKTDRHGVRRGKDKRAAETTAPNSIETLIQPAPINSRRQRRRKPSKQEPRGRESPEKTHTKTKTRKTEQERREETIEMQGKSSRNFAYPKTGFKSQADACQPPIMLVDHDKSKEPASETE